MCSARWALPSYRPAHTADPLLEQPLSSTTDIPKTDRGVPTRCPAWPLEPVQLAFLPSLAGLPGGLAVSPTSATLFRLPVWLLTQTHSLSFPCFFLLCACLITLFHLQRFWFPTRRGGEDARALTSCPSLLSVVTALWSNDHILCFVCFYCSSKLSSVLRRGLFKAATLLPNTRGKVFPACLAC